MVIPVSVLWVVVGFAIVIGIMIGIVVGVEIIRGD